MKFDILTLFPDFFDGPFRISILKRALEKGKIEVRLHNLRDYAKDRHRTCDDTPYGGGSGLVLKPEPLWRAISELKKKDPSSKVIVFSAKGRILNQNLLKSLKRYTSFILVAGHYEGIDERIIDHCADMEISIGDYVLTGGEIACLAFVDAMSRLVKGVLNNKDSSEEESFDSEGLLEYDQYTRPEVFRGWKVPEVLLSGDHEKIKMWRKESRWKNTKMNRPDLLEKKGVKL